MRGKRDPQVESSLFHTSERLDSWKDIAAYLKRSIRTARRWEKEETLPVHRHLHHTQGTVYAYMGELDAWRVSRRMHPAPRVREEVSVTGSEGIMLAVLPFQNLSDDPKQEYFSDGLTEEMISQLAQLNPKRLRVIARTSAMRYKQTKKDIARVGRELGVEFILEGAVRRAAKRVRITARLIRASDRTHLWAETYERKLADVFAIQNEIAGRITRSLVIELLPARQSVPVRAPTTNPGAHEVYLKGRYYWHRQTHADLKKSCKYFEQAIVEDPNYALAHVGLSDCYRLSGFWGAMSPRDVMPNAKAAALRALEINDNLGEAHISLAGVKGIYDWNWIETEKEYKRGMELNPGSAIARQSYAMVYLVPMGRLDEAIEEMKRAEKLDPFSVFHSTMLGWAFHLAGQYDQAIEQYGKATELDSNYHLVHWCLGWTYMQKSMLEKAVVMFERARALSGNSTFTLGSLGHAYGVLGKRREARTLLNGLKELSRKRYVPPLDVATLVTGLGEKDEALGWLEKAYEERCPRLVWLRMDSGFKSLRPDHRFSGLLRRMKLPEYPPGPKTLLHSRL